MEKDKLPEHLKTFFGTPTGRTQPEETLPYRPRQKYNHKEAFCWMEYEPCNRSGDPFFSTGTLKVWNSRDGVTPFCIFRNGIEFQHVNWRNDIQVIDPSQIKRILRPGNFIFRDTTTEEAAEFARKRIAQFVGGEYEVPEGSEQYDEILQSLSKDFVGQPILVCLDEAEIAKFGDLSQFK